MQCPGCGFENENNNKFCNMCGMGLPTSGDHLDSPAEREPLDLDLSLELDAPDNIAPSEHLLSLDLGNSNTKVSDLNLSLDSNDIGGIDLEMPDAVAKNDLDLDFGTANNTDFTFDLDNQTTEAPDLDFDISFGADNNALNLDLASQEPELDNEPLTLDEDEDPFAAPQSANLDISFDEPEPAVQIKPSVAPQATEKKIANKHDIDFNLAPETDNEDSYLEIDAQKAATKTESFDFGDLDAEANVSQMPEDEDINQFIVSTNDDLTGNSTDIDFFAATPEKEGEEDFSVNTTETDTESSGISEDIDTSFLDELEIETPMPPKSLQKQEFADTIIEDEEIDADDELNGLLMNIEEGFSKKPASIAINKPVENETEIFDINFTEDEDTNHEISNDEQDSALIAALGGDESISVQEDAFPEMPHGLTESAILEEAPPLSPTEQLTEIRQLLADAQDPDERYSLVLRLRELNLTESAGDFIKLLNDELKDIREIAAGYLGDITAKEAVRPLILCLTSDHPQLKFIAARSLGRIGAEEAVIPLVKLLEEDNEDLRYVTLEALGKIGSASALKATSAFLKSRNNDLRYVACEAIGNIGDPKSVTIVLPMLKDPEFEVRLKAIEALGKIGSTAACDQLLVVLSEENERIRMATIQALGQIRNVNAVDPLIDIFQVSNPQIKEKIIWALGEIGDAKAVDPLLKLSNAFNTKLTLLALEAFAKIKSAKASRYILAILEKEDFMLCLKAIEALGEIGEKSTAGNLIKFLDSAEPEHKISAARAIGKIGNPITIEPLVSRLTDSERDVRLAAIEALGYIKGAKAIEPLVKSLAEQDLQIVEKAEWAICEMGEMAVDQITRAIHSEHNAAILPSLVKILGRIGSIRAIFPLLKVLDATDDKRLATCIADSLIAIDDYLTTTNPISVILKEGYAWAQFSIAQALSNLQDERAFAMLIKIAREALTDKDIKKLAGIPDKRILECSSEILHLIRLNVTHLFAKVGNDKAIPVIMSYFSGGDLLQRQWCVEALGGIKTEGALDALIDILKKPEYNIPLELLSRQLIANQSRKLVEKLILGASHPAEAVRISIASVLGDTHDPRAIRTLSNLVKDTAEKVRTAAIEAIGKIGTTAAVQPAIEALRDSIETVRAKAAQVLGELKDTAAVEFLEKATKDSSEVVRGLAIKSLSLMADARVPEIIIASLSDKAESVRTMAVVVLGDRRDRIALPYLVKSLEDASEKVREAAAETLAKIGDPNSIMPMLARLDDPSPIVPLACSEAIVSFGENSYEVLIEALKHQEERIRRHACDLLIRIGAANLIRKLLKIAQDRNNFLRENIARILGKIGDSSVVETLMHMLTDRSSAVRKTAAESLGALRDIRCLVALKQGTRDQSREVRMAANMALQEIFKAHKLN